MMCVNNYKIFFVSFDYFDIKLLFIIFLNNISIKKKEFYVLNYLQKNHK